MATTKAKSESGTRETSAMQQPMEECRALATDMVNYLTEYTRENPGRAALACLGVGFVLGWKLKPW